MWEHSHVVGALEGEAELDGWCHMLELQEKKRRGESILNTF
jgi:hypothetical protein